MQFVFGSEVDYIEGLQGAGFQVNNPNVVAACGCGSSFQVKDDAAATRPTGHLRALASIRVSTDRPLTSDCLDQRAAGSLDLQRRALRRRGAAARRASGCSTPSASASSPDSNISSTMSAPPTSSPLT